MNDTCTKIDFGFSPKYLTSHLQSLTLFFSIYRSEGPECSQRLLCQANQDIFSRGHVIPSVMTYLSNLVMSIMVEDAKISQILLAAQHGRKGEVDCLKTYSKCKMKL